MAASLHHSVMTAAGNGSISNRLAMGGKSVALETVQITGHPNMPGEENSDGELMFFTVEIDHLIFMSLFRSKMDKIRPGWSWQFHWRQVTAKQYMSCQHCGKPFRDWVDMPIYHFKNLHFCTIECWRASIVDEEAYGR